MKTQILFHHAKTLRWKVANCHLLALLEGNECPKTPSTSEKYISQAYMTTSMTRGFAQLDRMQEDSQHPLRLGNITSILTPSISTQSLARNVLSCILDNPRKPCRGFLRSSHRRCHAVYVTEARRISSSSTCLCMEKV
jgi:hypothetical protein